MVRQLNSPSRRAAARGDAGAASKKLAAELSELLLVVREHARAGDLGIEHMRLSLFLESGARLELELAGRTLVPGTSERARSVCHPLSLALRPFVSIDDLDLADPARAAAQSLQQQFPDEVKFTSGRRSVAQQSAAMAANVAKPGGRSWILKTYKATPQRAALQKWVDDNPGATTAVEIEAGLLNVMNSWTVAQQRGFSRHITGDAFDVQPVPGEKGEKIKLAIERLPKLDWYTFSEGGLEIWHAQFDP